jgi:SP family xylose:H+ symportor-like MFS transporter
MAVSMLFLGFPFNASGNGTSTGALQMSWGPVTWVMLSEIFPNFIMGKAMGIAVAAQWIANLFASRSFKVLDGNSTLNTVFNRDFAYWIYDVMSLVAAAFVLRYVPETKGRSLEAVRQMWHGKAAKTKVA